MKLFTAVSVVVSLAVMNFVATSKCCGDDDWVAKLKERDTHFLFQTVFSVGLGGMKTSYHAKLLDENGFEYDAMSLLGSPVARQQLELSAAQWRDIRNIYQFALDEMRLHPSNKMLETDQAQLEPIFTKAQAEIEGRLTDLQLRQLEQVKHRLGIGKVGLSKYLTSSHFGNGRPLTVAESNELEWLVENLKRESQLSGKRLLEEANQKLLAHLTPEQQNRLDEALGVELKTKLLNSLLFTRTAQLKKKPSSRRNESLAWIRRSKNQTKLSLSIEQIEQIRVLDRSVKTLPRSILTQEQTAGLRRMIASNELQRRGTVTAIACSDLAKLIGLDEHGSDSFYQFGKSVFAELQKEIARDCEEQLKQFMQKLSPGVKARLEASIERVGIAQVPLGFSGVTNLR